MFFEPEYWLVIAMFVSFIALIFTGFPVAWVLAGVGIIFAGVDADWFQVFMGVMLVSAVLVNGAFRKKYAQG